MADVKNPMEGASYHASRLSDRFEVAGRELANKFGNIGKALVKHSDVLNAEEVDRLRVEAREQQMQAQLDFYDGKASQSDNEAYLFERDRLEKTEAINDAKREQSFQRSVANSERLRAIARTKDAERAATRTKLNEKFLETGKAITSADIQDTHRDILVDVNAGIVNDQVSAKLLEAVSGKSGLTQRELLKTVLDTSNEALEGMDADTKASIISRVMKKQKPFIEKAIAADRVAAIQRQQENAELSHASNFMDGKYSDPTNGVQAYLADVQRTAIAYGGDLNRAIQGSIKQVVSRAEAEMRSGNLDVYQQATTFLNKVTADNPALQAIAHKQLTAARKETYDKTVREQGNALQRAIAEGDEASAHQLFTSHQQHHKHPSYLTAFKGYQTFLAQKEKAMEGSLQADRWRKGQVHDPKKARKHVDEHQLSLLQTSDLQGFAVDAIELNHVGSEAKRYLNNAISDVSALQDWEASEKDPGRAVGVVNAYNALRLLPENLRDEALNNGIGGATFQAIDTLVKGGASAQDAARSVLTILEAKGDELKAIDKTVSFTDFYPGDDGSPSTKTTRQAETAFGQEVVSVASELVGTKVEVRGLSEFKAEAARLLKVQTIMHDGNVTEAMRRQAIRQVAHNYIAVPNPDAGFTDASRILVKPSDNPAAAREVRDAWKRANGKAAEQFENGVSLVKTTLPFLISTESSMAPSLTDAPDVDAARGWMAVTGGDDVWGGPIGLAPGDELSGVGKGKLSPRTKFGGGEAERVEVKKTMPTDLLEFAAEIEGMNRLMVGTPFQWLRRPGSSENAPIFYLGFRPVPPTSSLPEQVTAPELQTIGETADDTFKAAEERLRALTPSRLALEAGNGIQSAVFDPDLLPQARGRVIKSIVGHLTKSPESPVPRSLGLTVEVPDAFGSTEEAMEWLRTASNTHTINSKAARAPSLRDPQLPDHDNAINYLAGWNGNSNQATVDAVYRDRREIGVGVPLEADWVQELLRDRVGLKQSQVKDVVDGRKRLPAGAIKLLNIEAVNRAHQTLTAKIDQETLADMPFDARMVLTGLVIDGEKDLTTEIVEAVNINDWLGASAAIREATTGAKTKRLRQNLERKRISEAAQFEIAMGVSQ